jgi:glutamyl-tRNA(Gln) amidotransferase subunit D
LYPSLERARKNNVSIFMTLQTIWGYVHMYVYETGRDMLAKGVVPLGNMLPEVAFIKLGWTLGQTEDMDKIREIMLTPINEEITEREPYNGYLVYQGGVPEVEHFIRQYRK